MNYPFIFSDGGRSKSSRPKQTNDCTVRAIALATGIDYDSIYNTLAEAGRKCSGRFDLKTYLKENPVLTLDGIEPIFKFTWQSFPAVAGQRRMNPVTFSKQFNNGIFIVKVAKHVLTCIDGTFYDTSPEREDRCIYGAWKVERI
jgi:hypothetical protein